MPAGTPTPFGETTPHRQYLRGGPRPSLPTAGERLFRDSSGRIAATGASVAPGVPTPPAIGRRANGEPPASDLWMHGPRLVAAGWSSERRDGRGVRRGSRH